MSSVRLYIEKFRLFMYKTDFLSLRYGQGSLGGL